MNLDWHLQLTSAGRVRCEPGWSLDAAWSTRLQDCDLWFVHEGRGTMQTRTGDLELKPGTCLWMRPGGLYLARHDPRNPLGVTYMHFTPKTASGEPVLDDARLPPERFHVRDPLFYTTLSDQIVRIMRSRPALPDADFQRTASFKQATHLLHALVLELLDVASEATGIPRVHRAIIEEQANTIFEQPGQAPSVRELARAACLSPDHYGRLFRAINDCAPREWIQRARLQRASQLLRETPLSISEIAAETGYADVFQFSRIFKRRMGLAPSHWRQSDTPSSM
ncbi:MAG: AraC family transcriptional regulator [Opitutales bacterium]|nr:AraC family transcriptional regulator [Opitutales bacterium]